MQQRPLGRSGLTVSRLALGTMTWGHDTDPDDAGAQLKSFVDAGGTLVDTADVYADGEAEAVLGTLLDAMVPRDELVIVGKAGVRATGPRRRDGSRGHLLHSLDITLRRLGTDHLDVWQLHGHDPHTPIEETMSAIDYAVSSGRTRYAGVANHSGWQTARAYTWQQAWPGRAPIVAAGFEYSLLDRCAERDVLPACASLGIGTLPWSPLGRGVLTGKYRNGRPAGSRAASPQYERFVLAYLDPRCSAIVEAVVTAADGLGVSPAQVALSWIRDRPGVTAPVIGARTVDQLEEALRTEDLPLPEEIWRALDDVSAIDLGEEHY
ncbi:aldo/keto reductase [Hamadaea tsunoensis]|uniref:aldo/keto reductase n=1 Tax=Hamadaea tsunoensis TaxID=53368 RepID=UPI0004190FA4|nr:aldo/keto reductase [Hamadaea tsunoensis]